MKKANLEIRKIVLLNGLEYRDVARQMGIHYTSLSRLLRYEVSEEKKKEVMRAIEELITA